MSGTEEKKQDSWEGFQLFQEGQKYHFGRAGYTTDYFKAKSYYEKAIVLGSPAAMNYLAILYLTDKLGIPDHEKARYLFESAIAKGSNIAISNLAAVYLDDKLGPPNYEKAKALYEEAIRTGFQPANKNLALLYAEGRLGKPNYQKAKELYELATNSVVVDSDAYYQLGLLYLTGKLGEENIFRAREYFEQANKYDHPYAHAYCPNPLIKQVIETVDEIHRDQVEKSLTKLEETFFSIRDEHRMEGNVKLAHFTAWPAIESILSLDPKKNPDFSEPVTNCLRQYHVDYMNDPTEGHRLLKPDDETGEMLKNLFEKHYFNVFKTHQATADLLPSVFTVSLTKQTDRLDLWRAYGRDGAGFALSLTIECPKDQFGVVSRSRENTRAFTGEKASNDVNVLSPEVNLAPPLLYEIKYKDEAVKATLDKLRKPLQAVLRLKTKLGKESEDWQRVASCATAILLELLYLYKDEQYCNEHEVRALRTLRIDDPSVKLDERTPGRLYCETSPFLFRTPDSEIIVGPKVEDQEAALWNIRHRLAKLGLSPNTIVKKSDVPYR